MEVRPGFDDDTIRARQWPAFLSSFFLHLLVHNVTDRHRSRVFVAETAGELVRG
uniref:Uncharacterized protein n=1 Tax=Arundo donax TaxID=35708 RepID=A0A0A9DI47_ARUDO